MIPDELSASARALIAREAALDEPSQAELERAEALVYQALGLPLPPAPSSPPLNSPVGPGEPSSVPSALSEPNPAKHAPQLAGSAKVAPLISSIASGMLLSVSLFLATSPPASLRPPAVRLGSPAFERPAPSADPAPQSSLVPAPLPIEAPHRALASARRSASPRIEANESEPSKAQEREEEALLVAAAEAQLRAGHFASALTLFERHLAKYPSGMLRPEAERGRVLALCASGRRQEGRKALAALPSGLKSGARMEALARACQVSDP